MGNLSAIGSRGSLNDLPAVAVGGVVPARPAPCRALARRRGRRCIAIPTGSKYEHTVEIQREDGSTVAERLPDKEKAEVKGSFTTPAFALRRKYQRLIKGDDNLYHRHITKSLKALEQEQQPP